MLRDPGERQDFPISTYLESRDDSRLPRHIATQSRLPQQYTYPNVNRPAAGTSMLVSGANSLAALTNASSASTTPSVSSSLGGRQLETSRLLEPDHQNALQVAPLRHPVIFECPFNFLYCLLSFTNFNEWFAHSVTHFRGIAPPNSNKCCFCDKTFKENPGQHCWKEKLCHTALHHQLGHKLAHARPDFELHRYLWIKRLIDTAEYKALTGGSTGHVPATSTHLNQVVSQAISNSTAYTITNRQRIPRAR